MTKYNELQLKFKVIKDLFMSYWNIPHSGSKFRWLRKVAIPGFWKNRQAFYKMYRMSLEIRKERQQQGF